MSDDRAVLRLLGWCSAPTGAQPHHQLCRREYRSQAGVTHRCNCDCHTTEDDKCPSST